MNNVSTNKETPVKQNFSFVDTIRCISMMGIVFEHSATLWGVKYISDVETWAQVITMQFWKFATIAFFLIGGFLINYKFTEYTPGQYIVRRFKNTIKPWLFWIIVLIALNVIHIVVGNLRMHDPVFKGFSVPYFIEEIRYILFESSFWFILNFLICISILLIFKKYIYKLWFGLIWLGVSLIYSANLYAEWFLTRHSAALFGFVFFLWLGVYLNKYFEEIVSKIKQIKWHWIIILNILCFIVACLEVLYIAHLGLKDEYNTLRISNILYSLTMFILLLKIGEIKAIDHVLNPRATTFGIYLLHQILIIRLLPLILNVDVNTISVWQNIPYSILRFLVVYLIAFGLTSLLLKTKMKWAVGR